MRIVAGLERADSGEIAFDGRGISMIHQELLPFPDLTVAENVWMGQEPTRGFGGWLDKAEMLRGARVRLERAGVSIDPSRRMGDLSVAEIQAVEIAKALAREADLFILDEPTSALSARETEALFALIGDLRRAGAGILYISHHLEEIFRLADTITVLRDGRLVTTAAASALDEARLISLMVGRELDSSAARVPEPPGEAALEVRGLGRAGRFHGVSFTLRRGEVLGLAGLMGAGRSDVATAIYGLAPADEGQILVRGKALRIQSPAGALRAGIGMVTEDRKEFGVFANLSVRDNLTMTGLRRCSSGPLVRHGLERETAAEQMRRFGIRAAGQDAPAGSLSGGNQQKVVLAKALLDGPSILILDEPTRGIDVGAKAEIYETISELAREGTAVLLISSEMNEILRLSDRVLVMREGTVAGEVRPGETTQEEILRMAMPLS
jgi:ABC-type sugar transport system ATPase subunit